MSSDFFSRSTHRSRTIRQCEECRMAIEVGSIYESCRGKYDGDFYSYAAHPECLELSMKLRDVLDLAHDEEYRGLAEDVQELPLDHWIRQGYIRLLVGKRSYKEAKQGSLTQENGQ